MSIFLISPGAVAHAAVRRLLVCRSVSPGRWEEGLPHLPTPTNPAWKPGSTVDLSPGHLQKKRFLSATVWRQRQWLNVQRSELSLCVCFSPQAVTFVLACSVHRRNHAGSVCYKMFSAYFSCPCVVVHENKQKLLLLLWISQWRQKTRKPGLSLGRLRCNIFECSFMFCQF